MSDSTSRIRARSAAALDSPEARAAVLVDRMRAGTLNRDRVELAVFCGDPAARAALGDRVRRWTDGYLCCCGDVDRDHGMTVDSYTHSPVHACTYVGSKPDDVSNDVWSTHDDSRPCDCELTEHVRSLPAVEVPAAFDKWVRGLSRWGEDVQVRASVAATLTRIAAHERQGYDHNAIERAWRVCEEANEWLAEPSEGQAMRWLDVARAGGFQEWVPYPPGTPGNRPHPLTTATESASVAGEQPVREAIQRALVAWSLP